MRHSVHLPTPQTQALLQIWKALLTGFGVILIRTSESSTPVAILFPPKTNSTTVVFLDYLQLQLFIPAPATFDLDREGALWMRPPYRRALRVQVLNTITGACAHVSLA